VKVVQHYQVDGSDAVDASEHRLIERLERANSDVGAPVLALSGEHTVVWFRPLLDRLFLVPNELATRNKIRDTVPLLEVLQGLRFGSERFPVPGFSNEQVAAFVENPVVERERLRFLELVESVDTHQFSDERLVLRRNI